MNDYCVQDLILGGVKWEISDVPCVLRAQWAAASATVATATQNPSERKISNTINPRDTVVPPIAPSGTVTQDAAESMARRPNMLDSGRGKVFQYTERGELTAVFGSYGTQVGTFSNP